MAEEVNFLELACLLKITNNTVLEKFGSSINASIFDASNIAGTLKQNGLIDFTAYYPGPNEIVVTEEGKKLIAEADSKSAEPFDKLDETILAQLSGGKKQPQDIQSTINIRPKDLALRLYKLGKQNYIIYELKSGTVELLMTEAGFLKASAASPQPNQAAQPIMKPPNPQLMPKKETITETPQAPEPDATAPEEQKAAPKERTVNEVLKEIHANRQKGANMKIVVVIAVILIVAVLYLHFVAGLI